MVRDSGEGCGVGLVDVDALDRTAEAFGFCAGGLAADGVVEDEDLRSARPNNVLLNCGCVLESLRCYGSSYTSLSSCSTSG